MTAGSTPITAIDFLVVIMASGIARGRVRMTATATVEARKMAAILQIIGWQRHAALVFLVFFRYMTSCYEQLTPVKSTYPLTSVRHHIAGSSL